MQKNAIKIKIIGLEVFVKSSFEFFLEGPYLKYAATSLNTNGMGTRKISTNIWCKNYLKKTLKSVLTSY